MIFGMDVIHGYETTFPIPLGLSASWDMDLIQRSAQIAAQEASADGINWTFSPMVDVSREPRWGEFLKDREKTRTLEVRLQKPWFMVIREKICLLKIPYWPA